MSDAEKAYEAARRLIAEAKAEGWTELSLDTDETHALTRLPPEIAELSGLDHIDLDGTRVSDLSPLSGLSGLKTLWLRNTGVTDLSPLSGLSGLTTLALNNTGVSDLSPLSVLPGLTTLWLDDTGVMDLSSLSGLSGLTTLRLTGTGVTDLSPLSGLPGLNTLYLDNTGVSDLSPLSGLSGLTTLRLTRTGVMDLSPLSGLSGLTELWLNNTGVTDLSPLSGLSGLTELWLNNTGVTDLSPLSGLPGLTELRLTGTGVSDLSPLSGLSGLATLGLNGTGVSDLSPLSGLSGLTTLLLDRTGVSDLSPLSGLSGLAELRLDRTGVSDLSPLSGLSGLTRLYLDNTGVSDLSPLSGLSGLTELWLNNTGVSDLSPLSGLPGLTTLWLDNTGVTDLSPLAALTEVTTLSLGGASVVDLRPIRNMTSLVEGPPESGLMHGLWMGLTLKDSAAARADPRIAKIAEIENNAERARTLFDYLKDWVPPAAVAEDGQPTSSPAPALPTVEAVLDAQDLMGWRFSPQTGTLDLFVDGGAEDDRQRRLAGLVRDRLARLKDILAATNKGFGIRHDLLTEANAFSDLLGDETRSLPDRGLEFWAGMVAMGGLLDANDAMIRQGRDPLDCLTPEARSALQTLLAVGGGFVRAFPEARELDDAHGGFNRAMLPLDVLLAILEKARSQALISGHSGDVVEHVALVGQGEGVQADKAFNVTAKGMTNLVLVSALLGVPALFAQGVISGMGEELGADLWNHYELSEKAIRFLDSTEREIRDLVAGMSPDERANLRSVLRDYESSRGKLGHWKPPED